MCTCGIDMATQQVTPAMHSSTCRAPGERATPLLTACSSIRSAPLGDRCRRITRMKGSIASMQKRPMASWVGRQAIAGDEVLHDGRPQGAADVVARGADGDGDAAAAVEPVRDVGNQRGKARRAAEADDEVQKGELPNAAGQRRAEIAAAERKRADDERRHDAETIGDPSDDDPAKRKTDHGKGVGKGGFRPGDAEIRLDRGQRHDDRPHADAGDGADGDARGQPQPSLGRVDPGADAAYALCRNGHGARTIEAARPRVKALALHCAQRRAANRR